MMINKTCSTSKITIATLLTLLGLLITTISSALPYKQFASALRGYDAVAYQTDNQAIPGNSNFSVYQDGLIYLFKSKANANLFKANPEKYIPAYNGFCAMGVALGKKLPTDPQAFKVVNGKLYMNLNKAVQKAWARDIPGNIKKADNEWPKIKDTDPAKL